VEQNKKGALVKFREIEGASNAAKCTEPILGNPKIKIIYDIEPESDNT
jgi:hypothetical protein